MAENNVVARTLEVVLAEANETCDALNLNAEPAQHNELELKVATLVKEYNELALLTAYSTAKADELPIMALAKVYKYESVSLKRTESTDVVDGASKRVTTYSVQSKDTALNILKFIKWLQERNFKMPVGWIANMSAVKANILSQWKAFDEAQDEHIFKIGQLKGLLQPMVDDLMFIKGENDHNALVAKSCHARTMLKYANTVKGVLEGETLTPKTWDTLLMTLLHSIATGKELTTTYGSAAVYKELVDGETTSDGSEEPSETPEAETK